MNSLSTHLILLALIVFAVSPICRGANEVDSEPLGHLQGRILDAETQLPLPGAYITLPDLKRGSLSDDLGYFDVSDIAVGDYVLQISYLGYEAIEQEVRITPNQAIEVKVELISRPIDVEAIAISAPRTEMKHLRSIQALDLSLRPMLSAQDVLRTVPGLFIAQHAGGGKAEQIFLRGFDLDHGTDIALEVDGMPVNMVSHAHGQGYADLHFLIPETIESLDADKGPYSTQKGNFATAGYVDFRTRNTLDENQVSIEAGQFQHVRSLGMFNLLPNTPNHHAYIATEYLSREGYFDSPQHFHRLNLFAKYNGMVSERMLVSASVSTFDSRWDASGQIPLRAVQSGQIGRFGAIDDTEGGETSRSNLNLSLTQTTESGLTIRHRVYASRYRFSLFSNFTFFLEDPINGDQIHQREDRTLYGYQTSVQGNHSLGNIQMRTEAGITLRVDDIQDNELSHTRNRTELLERFAWGDVRESQAGIYLDHYVYPTDWLTLNAGIRYDQFRHQYEDKLTAAYDPQVLRRGIVSPKFKGEARITPGMKVYVSTGTGFHSNDSRVLLQQGTREILPRAYGVDVGVQLKPIPQLFIQAAIWGLWLEQEFVYVGDAGIVEPSGKTRRKGMDLSFRYQLKPWLTVDGDLTYTHARAVDVPATEAFIPLAPISTASGGFSIQANEHFNASLRVRHLGDRPANEDYSLTASGYTLLDAVAHYRYQRYRISLAVENLLNVEWDEAQFETTSRLKEEVSPVTEIHATPGTPFFARLSLSYFF